MENCWNLKLDNIHNVCRICLKEREKMSGLYTSDDTDQASLAELLESYMSIKIEEEEGLPNLICGYCESELVAVCNFKFKIDRSQKYLDEYLRKLNKDHTTDTPTAEDNTGTIVECSPEDILCIEDAIETNDSTEIKHENNNNVNKVKRTVFDCRICGVTCASYKRLTMHRRKFMHYTRKTTNCPKCNVVIAEHTLARHVCSEALQCKVCGKGFSNGGNLKRHRLMHNYEKKRCECPRCGQKFHYVYALNLHLQKEPPCIERVKLETYVGNYSCDICSETFVFPTLLQNHLLLHTDEKVICTMCGKLYSDEIKLKRHMFHMHRAKKKMQPKREFPCNECDKQYHTAAALYTHKRTHKGIVYKCPICSKFITQRGALLLHVKRHSGEKPYVCQVCSRAFNNDQNLQRHVKAVHDKIREFKCSYCEKEFSTKQGLIIHERIHTGEKPFACPVCGKRFVDRNSTIKHLKVHNKPIPN